MKGIYRCGCGLQTREPFEIGGTLYCAVCAEQLKPALVARKARLWHNADRPPAQARQLWRELSWD